MTIVSTIKLKLTQEEKEALRTTAEILDQIKIEENNTLFKLIGEELHSMNFLKKAFVKEDEETFLNATGTLFDIIDILETIQEIAEK